MKLLLTVRRRAGVRLIEYLDEHGRGVIRVPLSVWRQPRCEVGGHPFPRPDFAPSAIAELAVAMIDARISGTAVNIGTDVSPADVAAALRVVDLLDRGLEPGVDLAVAIAERARRPTDDAS